jgi:hypothetical protein
LANSLQFRQGITLGQIEHSIRQTFAALSRHLLVPGTGVEVTQPPGDMIENIKMLRKRFDCTGKLGVRCRDVCDSDCHDAIGALWAFDFLLPEQLSYVAHATLA